MHKFKPGQIVFEVPCYRYFHVDSEPAYRAQPSNRAWIVGPSGEFYHRRADDGDTDMLDATHAGEFRGTWLEALEAAHENAQRQATLLLEVVRAEVKAQDGS